MSRVLTSVGGALLCALAGLLAMGLVAGLRWLARRYGGPSAESWLHGLCFVTIGVLLGEALPLLWPALAPWHDAVLGACIGLVGEAARPGRPSRRFTPRNS